MASTPTCYLNYITTQLQNQASQLLMEFLCRKNDVRMTRQCFLHIFPTDYQFNIFAKYQDKEHGMFCKYGECQQFVFCSSEQSGDEGFFFLILGTAWAQEQNAQFSVFSFLHFPVDWLEGIIIVGGNNYSRTVLSILR